MTIIKNNIEIAKIYRGINSIGKAYVGDKLVFGGGVTPTPASSVTTYSEEQAECSSDGLCGTVHFDSETNVKSVT